MKKLPLKIDTLAIVSISLPEPLQLLFQDKPANKEQHGTGRTISCLTITVAILSFLTVILIIANILLFMEIRDTKHGNFLMSFIWPGSMEGTM